MKPLIKPPKLKKGDTVATVSLSWGGAGEEDFLWRYRQGKERLEQIFGLHVIELPNTLKGTDYLYHHPEKRAEDFMQAFRDETIKGIFSCIGGDDTIRLLPYIDFDVIKNNPKVFMGYSDTTANHYMCVHAGLSSFYGGAVLVDFAENVQMSDYTVTWMKKALFSTEQIGTIPKSNVWTSEYLPWTIENKNTKRHFQPNQGYQLLQGNKTVTGHLLGGCMEVLESLKGTILFPAIDDFKGAILFLETSEETPLPSSFKWWLRNYGAMGILNCINGIVFAKPFDEKYFEEYKKELTCVLAEYGRADLPVLCNLSFGHCEPNCCIPIGAMAEIDCESKTFSILESGVL
jgi:Uncharacterized proteins, homologs of microcin C7 resistance protein MccF